jgi:hypothetical protein
MDFRSRSPSVDGFVAGPDQSLANPFGEGAGDLALEPLSVRSTGLVAHMSNRVAR